jgi:hypothetical protein
MTIDATTMKSVRSSKLRAGNIFLTEHQNKIHTGLKVYSPTGSDNSTALLLFTFEHPQLNGKVIPTAVADHEDMFCFDMGPAKVLWNGLSTSVEPQKFTDSALGTIMVAAEGLLISGATADNWPASGKSWWRIEDGKHFAKPEGGFLLRNWRLGTVHGKDDFREVRKDGVP